MRSARTRPRARTSVLRQWGQMGWAGSLGNGYGSDGMVAWSMGQGRARRHSRARWTSVYCHDWSLNNMGATGHGAGAEGEKRGRGRGRTRYRGRALRSAGRFSEQHEQRPADPAPVRHLDEPADGKDVTDGCAPLALAGGARRVFASPGHWWQRMIRKLLATQSAQGGRPPSPGRRFFTAMAAPSRHRVSL